MSVRNRHNASSIVQDKKLIIVLTLFINVFVRGTLHAFADNISSTFWASRSELSAS